MKVFYKIFIIIIFLQTYVNAQFSLRGGMNFNSVTSGAFKRIGFNEDKYMFKGYYVGIGIFDESSGYELEYAYLKANAKYKNQDREIIMQNIILSILLPIAISYRISFDLRGDMSIGILDIGVNGTFRTGLDINLFLSRNLSLFASGMLNIGYAYFSSPESDNLYEISESFNGLTSGPEIKAGIRVIL